MKLKRTIATLLVACSVLATPLTAFAAHSHSWGPTMLLGYYDEQPLPWEYKCVTRHVYNYHECLTCAEVEAWESNTIEMEHNIVNYSCIYCGLTYVR